MMDTRILPGTAHIGEDDVDVALAIRGSTVSLHAGSILVGTWPVDECTITQEDPGTVTFVADGDRLEIRVTDDSGQKGTARRLGTTHLWIAASDDSWDRARRATTEPTPARKRPPATAVAALAAAVLVGGWSTMQSRTEASPPSPTTVTSPPATVPAKTQTPAPSPTAASFVEAWNGFAADNGSGLSLPVDLPATLSLPHLQVWVVAHPDGGLQSARLAGRPGVDAAADRQLLAAIGQFLAAADPSASGSARRALLARLGFDVNDPSLDGLDGSVEHDGLEYRITYDSASATLDLSVRPLG